ncbi:MAG: tRNA uridine-5-carboxymethylaminomethyl(34) synthesis GTPase MnmE [Deltaproteobacteria bacterium]|nr:tRNA uridine-5-carboxymethylaminomethyl(34) synthesis GTPase MnmE [Deltaproteobacteria bacterium]
MLFHLSQIHKTDDTICALATPIGVSALGIVRLSGSKALAIVENLTKLSQPLKSHEIIKTTIKNPKTKERVDEVCLSYFKNPKSYTGEDMIEIYAHGNPHILNDILHLCVQNGGRLAKPGEFSSRAFLNGKMDLTQAEAVSGLIHSKSSLTRKLAHKQLKGEFFGILKELKEALVQTLSHIEAHLDFETEGDVKEFSQDGFLLNKTENLQKKVEGLTTSYKQNQKLMQGLKVVFVGKPNVGKSSLFNAFLNEERAIVTEVPGTTRDVLYETVFFDQSEIEILDTAGVHKTEDVVEKQGIERTKKAINSADIIFVVVHAHEDFQKEDHEILTWLHDKKEHCVLLLNKADLGKRNTPQIFFQNSFYVSAKSGEGIDELKRFLKENYLEKEINDAEFIVTHQRHYEILEKTNEKIQSLKEGIQNKISLEYLACDVSEALHLLGEITGETTSEEVIQKIFSEFCIGK